MTCIKCDDEIDETRYHLGYKECTDCSDEEKYSAHTVYPHKTGAFVQPVSSETKKSLDRLDRRAVKVGGKINAPKAREWKDVVPTPTLKPKPKPQNNK